MSTAMSRALAAWSPLPDWVKSLALAVDNASMRKVAEQIGKSPALVSRILTNSYGARTDEIERMVRARLLADTVDCPLFGPIPLDSCIRHRRMKGPPHNAVRRAFAATCPTCPNNTDRREP